MRATLLLALVGSNSLTTATAQQAQWLIDRRLPGEFQGQLAYDEARERVVLFGGVAPTSWQPAVHSFTFEWDGEQWVHRATEVGEEVGGALCYDTGRRRVVRTFGGSASVPTATTEEWDGQAWTLRSAGGVVARAWHAATFHGATGRVLVFGGRGGPTWSTLGDTLQLTNNIWTIGAPGTSPGARYHHAMAYDAARMRSVLFGGYSGTVLDDTWEWDGTSWSLRPTAVRPSARMAPALAFDPVRNRMVLFGGSDATTVLGDTWEWDGVVWQQVVTAHTPLPRARAAMVFDRRAGHVLLFGGSDDPNFRRYTDTWAYDGVDWQRLRGPAGPARGVRAALVADSTRGRMVQFGGMNDPWTWESDGRDWRPLQLTPPPLDRYDHHVAFDACRGVTVLFGGRSPGNPLGDTWEWNGAVWTPRPGTIAPSPRSGGCMAFDVGRCTTVLFGGQDFQTWHNETWEWNGTTWSQRTTTNSPINANFAMTYDPVLARIVMFGGADTQGPRSDTWHYDGVNWTLMGQAGPGSPPPRYSPSLTFHKGRGRTVMFGGGSFGAYFDDLWEWDGSQWTPWLVPVRPTPQSYATLAFDITTDRLVVTCGSVGQSFGDTWVLSPQGPGTSLAGGIGCGAPTAPQLRSDVPFLGNDHCAVEIVGAAPFAPVLFVGSHTPAAAPLPGGCTQYVGQPIVTALRTANAYGGAACAVQVPMLPALRGVTAVMQAVVFDGVGPYLGTSWTGALQLTVGD